MLQYTHETILHGVNDLTCQVEKGVENPYTGEENANKLVIRRAGEYYSDCVLPAKVYVTEGKAGKPGKMTLDFAKVFATEADDPATADNEAVKAGLYQLQFRVKTPEQFFAEYASPNWQVFGKPMFIGFEIDEAKAADPAEAAKHIAACIKLALPEGNEFIKVSIAGTKVVVDATSDYMTFDKVYLEKYDPTACDSCLGEYSKVKFEKDEEYTIDDNELPFATADWLVENLRFPTYPNIRYASAFADERPVPGEVYTQFSFAYQSPRPGLGGLSGVGQGMTAVTRHIYYVRSAEVDAFKKKLSDFGMELSYQTKNA